MTDQEEIEILKKGVLRHPRTTLILVGVAVLISVFSVMYGGVQKTETTKQNRILEIQLKQAAELKEQLMTCESAKGK